MQIKAAHLVDCTEDGSGLHGGNPIDSPLSSAPKRYTALDGLRGVAAISVVGLHEKEFLGAWYAHSAYLAVDLFFCLSGFVIALAYGKKLASGMSWAGFMRTRAIRLYPLYLAGTLMAAAAITVAVLYRHDSSGWTSSQLAITTFAGVLGLPLPFYYYIYPLNSAAWSLFYEAAVNAAYASRASLSNSVLLSVAAAGALGIVAQVLVIGSADTGALSHSSGWAVFRVLFSFPVGILIHRLHKPQILHPAWGVLLGSLLAVLLWAAPDSATRRYYDTGFVLIVSPLLVLAGSTVRNGAVDKLNEALGFLSYPLYATHAPALMIFSGGVRRFAKGVVPVPLIGWLLMAVLIMLGTAAGLADEAVRRRLRRNTPHPPG